MKIANIDREILHNFWMTWGISIKFSEKKIFILSVEDTFFKKPQGGQIDPSQLF